MRDALPDARRCSARIGVNTGEVVAGTSERLVDRRRRQRRGAARAGGAAGRGVLSARRHVQLVRDAVEVEPVEPLAAEGQERAGRGVSPRRGAEPRGRRGALFDAPFVGREREQRLLREAFDRAAARSRVPALHAARRRGRRQVPARRGVPRAESTRRSSAAAACPTARASRTGRSSKRSSSCGRRSASSIRESPARSPCCSAARESRRGRRSRARCAGSARGGRAPNGRSSSCSTTCTGPRTRSSISSSTSRTGRATRRSCSSAWRGRSCSTAVRLGGREAARGDGAAGAARARRERQAARRARRRRRSGAARADPRGRGWQSAVRRGDRRAGRGVAGRGGDGPADASRRCSAARLDQLPRAERAVLERGAVEGQVFHRAAVQALAPEDPEVPRSCSASCARSSCARSVRFFPARTPSGSATS